MNRVIRPFAAEDLDALSLFAEGLNAKRETGSTFCCKNAVDIRQDFAEAMDFGFACWEGEKPLGLISCFPDMEKGNADCSLLIDARKAPYQEIAQALFAAAKEKLGVAMEYTFFFPTENENCRVFLQSAEAQRQVNEYILLLRQENWKERRDLGVTPRPILEEEWDAFAALHDGVFPGVYASGRDILKDLGKTRFVYVIADKAGLAAYGVLKTNGGKQATAEMLAVRKDARRQGFGRATLQHLAWQAFSQFGAEMLELVVDADNQNALGLYLDIGFQIRQENHCFILRRSL